MIPTETDITAWVELSTTLPDEDITGEDRLATETLHTEILGARIPTISGGATTPLGCHISSLGECDLVDPDLGELLPMALLTTVVLPPLPLEDDDLLALPVGHDLALDRSTL